MGKIKRVQCFWAIFAVFLLVLTGAMGCGGDGNPPAEEGQNTAESEATLLSNRILEFLTLSVSQEFSTSTGSNFQNGTASPFAAKGIAGPAATCPSGALNPMACPRGGSISIQSLSCSSEGDGSLSVCGTVDFSQCQDLSAAGCPILEGPVEFCLNLSDTSTLRFFSRGNPLQTSSCDDSPGFQVLIQQASCTFPVQPFVGNPVANQCADHRVLLKGESGCMVCTEGSCLTDGDCDEAVDVADNCLVNFNPRQTDRDGDGEGDICEAFLPGGVDCSSRACEDSSICYQIKRFCPGGNEELGEHPSCCDGMCAGSNKEGPCPPGTCPEFAPKHCQSDEDCGEMEGCREGCCFEGFEPSPDCFCECPVEAGPAPAPGPGPVPVVCILCEPGDPQCGPPPPPPPPP